MLEQGVRQPGDPAAMRRSGQLKADDVEPRRRGQPGAGDAVDTREAIRAEVTEDVHLARAIPGIGEEPGDLRGRGLIGGEDQHTPARSELAKDERRASAHHADDRARLSRPTELGAGECDGRDCRMDDHPLLADQLDQCRSDARDQRVARC